MKLIENPSIVSLDNGQEYITIGRWALGVGWQLFVHASNIMYDEHEDPVLPLHQGTCLQTAVDVSYQASVREHEQS